MMAYKDEFKPVIFDNINQKPPAFIPKVNIVVLTFLEVL